MIRSRRTSDLTRTNIGMHSVSTDESRSGLRSHSRRLWLWRLPPGNAFRCKLNWSLWTNLVPSKEFLMFVYAFSQVGENVLMDDNAIFWPVPYSGTAMTCAISCFKSCNNVLATEIGAIFCERAMGANWTRRYWQTNREISSFHQQHSW